MRAHPCRLRLPTPSRPARLAVDVFRTLRLAAHLIVVKDSRRHTAPDFRTSLGAAPWRSAPLAVAQDAPGSGKRLDVVNYEARSVFLNVLG
jgi:hypothetical protein